MAPILQLRAVKAFYGQSEVVHGIDVAVEEGGMTVLLGANGAGKTTTLRAICGMVRSEGEILFAGERLDRRSTEEIAGLGVAHVPEGRGTFIGLTVEENLRLGGYTRGGRAARRACSACTDIFRSWPNAGGSRRARCPAANSRCWPSPAP